METTTTTPGTVTKAVQIVIVGLLAGFLAVLMSANPASAGEPPEPLVEPGWTGAQIASTCASHGAALFFYLTGPGDPSRVDCIDSDDQTIFVCLKLKSDRTWLCFSPPTVTSEASANHPPLQAGEMIEREPAAVPVLADASHIIIMNGVATEMAE